MTTKKPKPDPLKHTDVEASPHVLVDVIVDGDRLDNTKKDGLQETFFHKAPSSDNKEVNINDFNKALDFVINSFDSQIKDPSKPKNYPDEITIDFTLGFKQGINAWFIRGSAEAGVSITLKWSK